MAADTTPPRLRDLLERAAKRLKVGEGLSLATDPPTRYYTPEQELIRGLLEELTAARLAKQEARDALKRYGRHDGGCPIAFGGSICHCGLEKVLNGQP